MEFQIRVTKKKQDGQDKFSKLVEQSYYDTSHPYWTDKKGLTLEGLRQTPLEDLIYKLGQAFRYAVLMNKPYIRVEINHQVLPEHRHGAPIDTFFGIPAANIPDDQECQVYVGEY